MTTGGGHEFYKLVNIKGKKALKIYANATPIRNNEGDVFYIPTFGGDSIILLEDIPQTIASISGRVTDIEQKPISNATLILKTNNEEIPTKTDGDGKYILNKVGFGRARQFSIEIEASKYEHQIKNISLKEGMNEFNFILTPKKQTVPGFEVLTSINIIFILVYIIKYKKLY